MPSSARPMMRPLGGSGSWTNSFARSTMPDAERISPRQSSHGEQGSNPRRSDACSASTDPIPPPPPLLLSPMPWGSSSSLLVGLPTRTGAVDQPRASRTRSDLRGRRRQARGRFADPRTPHASGSLFGSPSPSPSPATGRASPDRRCIRGSSPRNSWVGTTSSGSSPLWRRKKWMRHGSANDRGPLCPRPRDGSR